MSRARDYWIHQQLEPNDIIIAGNAKRFKPAWVEKNEAIQKFREQIGEEEFKKRLEEDNQRTVNREQNW